MGRLVGATCRPTGHKSIISSGVVFTAVSRPEDSESSASDSDVGFRPGYKPGRATISIATYRPMGRTGAKYSGRPKNADRLRPAAELSGVSASTLARLVGATCRPIRV